jgi:DNA-directed RNA polymerase sigma subunit (sigma70/sigma32)
MAMSYTAIMEDRMPKGVRINGLERRRQHGQRQRARALMWRNRGYTFREIGEKLGVTTSRARQLVVTA